MRQKANLCEVQNILPYGASSAEMVPYIERPVLHLGIYLLRLTRFRLLTYLMLCLLQASKGLTTVIKEYKVLSLISLMHFVVISSKNLILYSQKDFETRCAGATFEVEF